ncbi:GntP family permease [Haloferax mediterranei ATCC 33500]|uniref:Gluconate permease n=1 Tax=Haloferax mediterranei (strain ATCC 33500 / DSM 1411 / JCM 8866 / NBRC 14739 / NCIMB 2177 / R-4) TaxID=523841 RepID=I3R6S6_HALMT|nr:gluconate:H+ symporter [Haloferax mediterranei]AFK19936.1 gluconate permease gntP [Haloferax mediterranei ATCC 33500]AHZ23313.1 gluconate transporter [Haloferax mediterranei ATCC 33500]ELZ99480.1 gluconate permease [Haloferax mediterranei ATCC 33500]MDX5987314.1 gluconate:H+ symporter [Haloferax mediterranei ATCC 33500]QCQ73829.1 GntP family permease [Haloferax mediterranei ATCC 33500]
MVLEFAQSPLLTFVVGLALVVLLLVVLDLPAFVGLAIAAFAVGLVNAAFVPDFTLAQAATKTATAFGDGMAGIGIPILMAAIIGKSMLESGSAQRIVRSFQSLVGKDNSDIALWGSSTVLAIPVFFDSVFYLMAPLARSMRARMGDNYALYLVVVGAGAATAHVFIPPTPGPLAVASEIGADIGTTMLIGVTVAVPSATMGGLVYGRWINRRIDIPLRDAMGTTTDELQERAQRDVSSLPSFLEATAPIVIAVALVGSLTVANALEGVAPMVEQVRPFIAFIGDKNVALTVAALAAAYTYYRWTDLSRSAWEEELTEALKSGGNIAAITSMGGAFGALLAASGIGPYIANGLEGFGIPLLVTAWLIAAIVRVAQGSATAAMLTAAGIMAPLTGQLPVHTAYLVMVIGAGGNICSWYNDSGFWLVKEIGGLTQAETLKTWTALTTIISVTGLVVVLVVSTVFPLS